MASLTIDKHPDRGYQLHAACTVPRPIDEVFDFFSDAHNLEELTPDWIRFQVLDEPGLAMHAGRLIDYKLRIRGLPMRWRSEITAWEPGHRFVDEQRRGPYRWWRHEHLFESRDDGTRVIDRVHFGVPGGRLVYRLFVGPDVRKIFAYRQQALERRFGATPMSQPAAI